MDNNEMPQLTYSKFNDMIYWSFDIDYSSGNINLDSPEERAIWLADVVASCLRILPGFAEVENVYVTTDSKGDNGFVLKPATPEGLQLLDHFLRNTQDIADVGISLRLECLQLKGKEESPELFYIHGRSRLVLDNHYSKFNLDYLDEAPASIRLAVGTDIYSPFTLSPLRDNRKLAALNGARLRSFLHGLHDLLPLRLTDINDHGYSRLDLIDRYGFKMPANPVAIESRIKYAN